MFDNFVGSSLFKTLTPTEQALVAKFSSKRPADLPKYFNAATQTKGQEPREPISREFEAFLILQSLRGAEKLSEANRWFGDAGKLQVSRTDRDTMISEAVDLDQEDSIARTLEVRLRLQAFIQFRENFTDVDLDTSVDSLEFPQDRFTQVPEIGLILRDSQAVMGEIATKQSRLEHSIVFNEVNKRNHEDRLVQQAAGTGSSDNALLVEELLSLRNVIAAVQSRVSGTV